MATQVWSFNPSVPAGTQPAAPQVTALTLPPGTVRRIEVRIPPGPRGQLGFALGAAGQPVIPFAAGSWIIADDEPMSWELQNQIDSGAWQLFAYNTGQFAHTVYVRIFTDPPSVATVTATALIDPSALSQPLPVAAAV